MLIYLGALERYAPIAQLDRVTDYESVGRGFESLSAYQKADTRNGYLFFYLEVGTRKGLTNGAAGRPA